MLLRVMMHPTRSARVSFRLFIVLFILAGTAMPMASHGADQHCLWKVQGPKTTVHLLGSIHLLKKEDYPLPAVMEQAFTNARVVGFETDIEALDDPKAQFGLLSKAQLPEGETLASQLSKETYAKLTAHLKETGVPGGIAVFEHFRPWFVAMGLLALELPALGLDPQYGVDKHFYGPAREAGKTILPLETVDFQLGLFANLSKEEQQSLMESTLKDIKNMRTMLEELVGSWRKGDAVKLDKLINQALVDEPVLFRRLVTDRNVQWVDQIEKLLKGDKPALIIVGAAPLVGKDSVVEMLQKKGFKVVQE